MALQSIGMQLEAAGSIERIRDTPVPIDLPSHQQLQELVELAAEICDAPIGLVSLLDDTWQTVLASVGLRIKQVRRDITVCAHTLAKNDLMIVEDMVQDLRFSGHPMVTGDPEIRFYAGLPLQQPDGATIGTLCVIDIKPRKLSATQGRALRVLARQIKTTMQLRMEHRLFEEAISERDKVAAPMEARERLLHAFINHGPLLTYVKDAGGRYLFYNRQMADRCGVSTEQWLGRDDVELFGEEHGRPFRNRDMEVLATGRLMISEDISEGRGLPVTWRSYKFPYKDEVGNLMLAGISIDVTQEKSRQAELDLAREEIKRLTAADTVTGLPRRQALDDRLDQDFEQAQVQRQSLAMIIIDVDNLRVRNQRLGTPAGDTALKAIGGILKACVTEADLVVRFSGAEFVLLLPDTSLDEAKGLAERVRREMAKVDWGKMPVTLSMGIATNAHAKRGGRQLLCFADDAMYTAKTSGRNRIVVYTPRNDHTT